MWSKSNHLAVFISPTAGFNRHVHSSLNTSVLPLFFKTNVCTLYSELASKCPCSPLIVPAVFCCGPGNGFGGPGVVLEQIKVVARQ